MAFNLADLFEAVADAVPAREAVVARERRVTYAQLDERATRFANGLRDAGVVPGEHVGLLLYNSIEHLEAMLGCYKARAVPINVNYRYVAEELAYLFDDADVAAVVHHREFSPLVAAVLPRCLRLRLVVTVDDSTDVDAVSGASRYEDLITRGAARRGALLPRSGDDHYVLYTGGTTGRPKGVVWRQEDIFFGALGGGNPGGPPITHPDEIVASVVENPAQRLRAFLPPGDAGPDQFVSMSLGPLMHASGQWSALGALLGGGKVVLPADRPVDMTRVLDLVERERVNACNLVGDASAVPLLAALEAEPSRWDTSALLLLGSGGSILSGDVKDRLMHTLPSVLAIVEGIGSSESPAQAVALTTRGGGPSQSLTFGAKAETMVVDDDLRPIPNGAGIAGRLATRGRVPLGYYKDPARSAQTFVEIDGIRWSLPGDMATIDADGTVHLLGRGSLCINTGGEKVYPEEVEAVLKEHPAVLDAVVVGVRDATWGERVAAVVASSDARPPTLDELQQFCRARLAGYKVPRALHIVAEITRSPAGKADYAWARTIADGRGSFSRTSSTRRE